MKLRLITLLLLISFSLSAQTYISIPWREGVVTISGKDQTGMIRLGGDLAAPWLNNTKVYFATKEAFGDRKDPKNKDVVEYEPEDIDGYSTYTEDKEGERIEMIFSTQEILLVKGLSKKDTKVFLQQKENGAVNIYEYTPKPESQSSEDYQYALLHTTTYFKKGDGAIISAVECDMSDLLSECPEVVARVKSGAYGFTDLNDRPKKKGMGKLWENSAGDNDLESKICVAVYEYNVCMK